MDMPDWPAVTAETIRHLQTLLRMDTTNPPGNESVAAEYLAAYCRRRGSSRWCSNRRRAAATSLPA